jgi:geranylgeranyl pyrophosphate synthase
LIRLALNLGAILSGADDAKLAALTEFAEIFGNAYQKSDDIIDVCEDKGRGPCTAAWPGAAAGVEARRDLEECVSEGKEVLAAAFPHSPARSCLYELLEYTIVRLA